MSFKDSVTILWLENAEMSVTTEGSVHKCHHEIMKNPRTLITIRITRNYVKIIEDLILQTINSGPSLAR